MQPIYLMHQQQQASDYETIGRCITKIAGDVQTAVSLSGTLYASSSGWILLSVPNELVRGVFSALDEPGVELPPSKGSRLNAHISVMKPNEIRELGGVDKITERGKRFKYTLTRFASVKPDGWDEMEKCWMIQVNSPELKALRRSYGLTPLPGNNEHEFHITCAVRRKKVLLTNTVTKTQKVPITSF